MSDPEDVNCVITGCIARNLPQHPTNTGDKYEVTVPYAQIMSTRLRGKPLLGEHKEDGPKIGEILQAWLTPPPKRDWYIKALIDRTTRAGNDMIKAIMNDKDNPWPGQVAELSLCHAGTTPYEVSMVAKGARPNSTVERIEMLDSEALNSLKTQQYIQPDVQIPSDFPTDTPLIAATFPSDAMSGSYTALRKPNPPTSYASMENAPEETQPVLQTIAAMRSAISHNPGAQKQIPSQQQQNPSLPQQQQQQQQQQQPNNQDEVSSLRKRLAELESRMPSREMQQANRLIEKMQTPMSDGDPNDTGNTHSFSSNPEDDKLIQMANMFDQSNVLSNPQREAAKGTVLEIAKRTKEMRDEIARRDAETAEKNKLIQELQAKVQHHETDMQAARKQTATMLKRLLVKTTPQQTEKDESDMDGFETNFVAGRTDQAFKHLTPQLVRASAFVEAAEAIQRNHQQNQQQYEDADMSTGQQGSFMAAVQQVLQPRAPMIKASAGGGGQKRSYENMNSNPIRGRGNGNSSTVWDRNMDDGGVHPMLRGHFMQLEQNGVEDTVSRGAMESGKYNKF